MEVDTKPSYRNHIANVNTYFNSLCQIVSHHYKITKKENGVITREMAKVPSFSLMDESTLVTGSMVKCTVTAFANTLMAIDIRDNVKMIKQTVKVFTLGLMAIDTREIVQKSCSAYSRF